MLASSIEKQASLAGDDAPPFAQHHQYVTKCTRAALAYVKQLAGLMDEGKYVTPVSAPVAISDVGGDKKEKVVCSFILLCSVPF